MDDPVWGERIFEPQPFTVCGELAKRSFADRMEDEIRALADERRQQIIDDMRHGTPTRPPGMVPKP